MANNEIKKKGIVMAKQSELLTREQVKEILKRQDEKTE